MGAPGSLFPNGDVYRLLLLSFTSPPVEDASAVRSSTIFASIAVRNIKHTSLTLYIDHHWKLTFPVLKESYPIRDEQ